MAGTPAKGPGNGSPRHPDFGPGNTAALKHGAKSPRQVAPIAEQIADTLVDVAPWTASHAYRPTVQAWAWVEAQAQLVRAYIDEHGLLDDKGQPRPAADYLERIEKRAATLRGQLGLDPTSMVRLLGALSSIDGPAAAQGLEALKAAGAEIRRGAEQRAMEAGDE